MAVKTFVANEVLTASDTNTYLNNGGLVYITSTALSGSSVSINNCFNSTFTNYVYTVDWVGSSNTQNLMMRLRSGGSDRTNADYYSAQTGVAFTGTTSAIGGNGVQQWSVGGSGDAMNGVVVTVYRPAVSIYTVAHWSNIAYGSAFVSSYVGGGASGASASFDGFTIYPSAGTFTGTVTVYGYRKA